MSNNNLNITSNWVQTDTISFTNQNIKRALEPFLKVSQEIKLKKKIKQKDYTDRIRITKIKINERNSKNKICLEPEKYYYLKTRNIYPQKNKLLRVSSMKDNCKINNIDLLYEFRKRLNSQETIKECQTKKILNKSVIYSNKNHCKIINNFVYSNSIMNNSLKNKKQSYSVNISQKSIHGFNINDNVFSIKMTRLKKKYPKIKNNSVDEVNIYNYAKRRKTTIDPGLFVIKNIKIENKHKNCNIKNLHISLKKKKLENEKFLFKKKIHSDINENNLNKFLPTVSHQIKPKVDLNKV